VSLERLTVIMRKLVYLREVDGERRIEGAVRHKYVLHAPLMEHQVQQFEIDHGVALPEAYRTFLTFVGNGGAGPFSGLLPLEEGIREFGLRNDPQLLSRSFPIGEAVELSALIEEQTDFDPCASSESMGEFFRRLENDPSFKMVYDALDEQFHSPYYSRGSLMICDYGCGIVFRLIVTGDERGNIWLDDRANDNGVYPILDPRTGQHIDFCTWYETWLDHSLRLLEGAAMGQDENLDWPWASVANSGDRYWPWGK
jgi:hypothetical protein